MSSKHISGVAKRFSIIIFIILFLSSCNSAENFSPHYVIDELTSAGVGEYDWENQEFIQIGISHSQEDSFEQSISVQYPKIVGLNNIEYQNLLNQMIEESVKNYNYWMDSKMDDFYKIEDVREANTEYQITLENSKLVSIAFSSRFLVHKTTGGQTATWTINFDLENGKLITLPDLFLISDEFFETVFSYYNSELNYLSWKKAFDDIDKYPIILESSRYCYSGFSPENGGTLYIYLNDYHEGYDVLKIPLSDLEAYKL